MRPRPPYTVTMTVEVKDDKARIPSVVTRQVRLTSTATSRDIDRVFHTLATETAAASLGSLQ